MPGAPRGHAAARRQRRQTERERDAHSTGGSERTVSPAQGYQMQHRARRAPAAGRTGRSRSSSRNVGREAAASAPAPQRQPNTRRVLHNAPHSRLPMLMPAGARKRCRGVSAHRRGRVRVASVCGLTVPAFAVPPPTPLQLPRPASTHARRRRSLFWRLSTHPPPSSPPHLNKFRS